jgi:cellulose synthase operon protein YhjQ
MVDHNVLPEQNETPEDVATLYSWANLHGAKYRDFSASRAQTREKARQRMQQAVEDERERARGQAEAEHAEQLRLAAESARAEEQARLDQIAAEQANRREAERQAAMQAARLAAEELERQAAQRAAFEAQRVAKEAQRVASEAQRAASEARATEQARAQRNVAEQMQVTERAAREAAAAEQAMQQIRHARQAAWQQQNRLPETTAPTSYFAAPSPEYAAPVAPRPVSAAVPSPVQPPFMPMREEAQPVQRGVWADYEPRESAGRPAWLTAERAEPALMAPVEQVGQNETLQSSRDRLASRWFALKGVFQGGAAQGENAQAEGAARTPVLAVFSMAGGVGKTSLAATLGRALSARGERILLVDTVSYGMLPYYFGTVDQRPGHLRTFVPPGNSADAPIQMVTLDSESMVAEGRTPDSLVAEIGKFSHGVNRVIVDLPTGSAVATRRLLRMTPVVLVPLMPNMNSVVSIGAIDAFFRAHGAAAGVEVRPYYVLNQFDASQPLHLDVREVLREHLGERLLPFALRRTPAVSEALAEGMTIMDYAPGSTVAEDFGNLAGWFKSQSAPASSGLRGVRWSER